eukprot:CAMPEP_0178408622 /NCGR_PEP_ID=MMETSP0689_2-20121128/20038_1 /TAXON_ID=160604 /ORGANISM="Amphidinium massartii, Strain CS-259" /LENGTH=157 /DNA_ID=CAMNT_0020029731 /DNA_START=88 /DNA_END=561 /DNA_ORIENTATION=-
MKSSGCWTGGLRPKRSLKRRYMGLPILTSLLSFWTRFFDFLAIKWRVPGCRLHMVPSGMMSTRCFAAEFWRRARTHHLLSRSLGRTYVLRKWPCITVAGSSASSSAGAVTPTKQVCMSEEVCFLVLVPAAKAIAAAAAAKPRVMTEPSTGAVVAAAE